MTASLPTIPHRPQASHPFTTWLCPPDTTLPGDSFSVNLQCTVCGLAYNLSFAAGTPATLARIVASHQRCIEQHQQSGPTTLYLTTDDATRAGRRSTTFRLSTGLALHLTAGALPTSRRLRSPPPPRALHHS